LFNDRTLSSASLFSKFCLSYEVAAVLPAAPAQPGGCDSFTEGPDRRVATLLRDGSHCHSGGTPGPGGGAAAAALTSMAARLDALGWRRVALRFGPAGAGAGAGSGGLLPWPLGAGEADGHSLIIVKVLAHLSPATPTAPTSSSSERSTRPLRSPAGQRPEPTRSAASDARAGRPPQRRRKAQLRGRVFFGGDAGRGGGGETRPAARTTLQC
jgi:hypothetical protein